MGGNFLIFEYILHITTDYKLANTHANKSHVCVKSNIGLMAEWSSVCNLYLMVAGSNLILPNFVSVMFFQSFTVP